MKLTQEDILITVQKILEAMMEGKRQNPKISQNPFIAAIVNLETEEYVIETFNSEFMFEELGSNFEALHSIFGAPIIIRGAETWYSGVSETLLEVMRPGQDPDRKEMLIVQAHSKLGTAFAYVFFKQIGNMVKFEDIQIKMISRKIPFGELK